MFLLCITLPLINISVKLVMFQRLKGLNVNTLFHNLQIAGSRGTFTGFFLL